MRLMKLIALTMLSAAIKRQCSSVLPLLCHCFSVFSRNLRNSSGFCIIIDRVTLIVSVNTPLDRSAE